MDDRRRGMREIEGKARRDAAGVTKSKKGIMTEEAAER